MAGREVAVDSAIARRAIESVVRAAVALVRRRVADRAGLDEGGAPAAARTVRVRDATPAVARPARARAGLAGSRPAVVVRATWPDIAAPACILGANATARTRARGDRAAAAGAGAVRARC